MIEAQDKRLGCGDNDMRVIEMNIQIKLFVPRRRERSFDDLSGLARVAVGVDSDERECVWEPRDISFDKPVGCYNCLWLTWVSWEVPRADLR
jgi:hypothetical protein